MSVPPPATTAAPRVEPPSFEQLLDVHAGRRTFASLIDPARGVFLAEAHTDFGNDDPPADAVVDGALLPIHQGSADGHAEARPAVRLDQPDGPGVNVPRGILQAPDNPHGADFRCPGNGAAGEQSPENFRESGLAFRAYGGGHLPDGGIFFDAEGICHRHAAGSGNSPQIVAQHIGDHGVFRAVLFGLRQLLPQLFILGQPSAPPGGALHGTGGEARTVLLKK